MIEVEERLELPLTRLRKPAAHLDFGEALLSHIAWKGRLRAFIDGLTDLPAGHVVERDDLCELGNWIHHDGAAFGNQPAYEDLRNLHAMFHRAAARVVTAVERGNRTHARELLGPGGVYAVHSVGIISAILRMGALVVDWPRKLDLGFEALDASHRELQILLESLERAVSEGASADEVGLVLMQLMTHATDHFLAEHDLMRSGGYDRARMEAHIEAHNYFLEQVQRLQRACSLGKVDLLSRTVESLRPWLVDHLRVHDAELGAHVQGLSA